MNSLFKLSKLNVRNYTNAQTNHFMSKPVFFDEAIILFT